MNTLKTEQNVYLLSDYQLEKIKPLIEGLDPFDVEVILEALIDGKYLLTPEKVEWH